MNISEAKEQVLNAVRAYLAEDEFGRPLIPTHRQRPLFLVGAPGIGKTEIMEQVAGELGIGLVSYAMSHHTRQSALGLPLIESKEFQGRTYQVTEYTMSEIIASVYELMEDTGVTSGILFLDEINCVSETLAPSMLQFLQYKTFGRHRVPNGWAIVTAGNPPEYNRAVREFDIATLDRVKRLDIEPDFETWRTHVLESSIHGAVLSFLDLNKDYFYRIERTPEGNEFVTARSWSDLSDALVVFEREGLPVDANLIGQYIQYPQAAEEFAFYYDLYQRYRSEYGITGILEGNIDEAVIERAQDAEADERFALVSLLVDGLTDGAEKVIKLNDGLLATRDALRSIRALIQQGQNVTDAFEAVIDKLKEEVVKGVEASSLTDAQIYEKRFSVAFLTELLEPVRASGAEGEAALDATREMFDARVQSMEEFRALEATALTSAFAFIDAAFGKGPELTLLVTELTARYYCSRFIAKYGCDEYYENNSELLVFDRATALRERMAEMDKGSKE